MNLSSRKANGRSRAGSKWTGALLLLSALLMACGENASLLTDSADPAEQREQPLEESASSAQDKPDDLLENGAVALTKSWTGDLDGMEVRRVIRILTVYGPGRFYLDEGRGRGIVAELATRFEEHLNKEMNRKHVRVHTLVIPVARGQLVPALLSGRGDLIVANLTITKARQSELDFSIPASKPLNEILVTGPSAPQLNSLEDLAGETLYLRNSSSYRESVDAVNARFQTKGLAAINISPMPEELEDDDLIEMVNAGLLPWAVVDDYKPQLWKDVFKNIRARKDLVFRKGGRTAWAMRKNNPLLKASVNSFLKKNREGTLIGNILNNRYIRDFDWAGNALGEEDYRRFNELQDIFKRYGEAYGIEYLFAAAQGYQESRLDQSVRSSAGAVGVMQLLPSTAADKNVGIPNIEDLDANIHAGIKYMDFLRDHYFSDPAITPLNQALLALGAYNAGPSRMISMRDKAAQQGYDPNVWFDNVELIAAREIGRETVQYVSNVYRYYTTYRMIAMQEMVHVEARKAAGISDEPSP
jgi:membrane-bound lytic murein transglycosylase MltF